jgi:hypothetical protein
MGRATGKRTSGLLLAAALCAAGASRADDAAVAQAFRRVDGVRLSPDEARAQVASLMAAMAQAGLARSSTVALSLLSSEERQAEAVRDAARAELAGRAAQDPSLAQALLSKDDARATLPPALALQLARGHLEKALRLAPLEEGVAFQALRNPSQTANAAATVPPDAPDAGAAPGPARRSRAAQNELARARALAASVPANDPQAVDAHEVAGLAAIAEGDSDLAQREFAAIAAIPVRRGDGAAGERRDRAFLQLARLAYAGGDDARADALYRKVSRDAPEWLDALFEASWSHFRRGEDEQALGNLLTLQAPFFQTRFFPESFVLKALVLYENCRYADAQKTLAEFEQRYRPLHDGLAAAIGKLPTAQGAFEFLAGGPAALQQGIPAGALDEIGRIEQAPDLHASVAAVAQLAAELDSLDDRAAALRPFVQRLAPFVHKARLELLESAGQKLLARLSGERGDLRELLGQSLRLSFEIAGREKELLAAPEPGAVSGHQRARSDVEDDEVLWPFEGEYWRDELGSYRYSLGRRCARARAVPVHEAISPAATEEKSPAAASAP